MTGYNLPSGISASDKDAPWNQGVDDDELLRQEKVELLEKAQQYCSWLLEVLDTYRKLDKDEFFLEFQRRDEVGRRIMDRMDALQVLKMDTEYLLMDYMPKEEDDSCDPES